MSEALRRPLHSPALGIPDMWPAFARAAAVQALVGNKKWTKVAAISLTTAAQVVATLSMTAKVTGRFRVRATGVLSTNSAGNTFTASVSHGTNVTAADYSRIAQFIPYSTDEVYEAWGPFALIVDYSSLTPAVTFTVGATAVLNLVMLANANSAVEIQANAMEFEAEEF